MLYLRVQYLVATSLSFLLIISQLNGFSQDTLAKKLDFSAAYTRGFLIAHRPLVVPLQQDKINGLELTAAFQTDGLKEWHHMYQFPRTGLSLSFWDLGNREQLGTSVSLIPYIDFPLTHSPKSKLYFKFGWGIGYVPKPFDSDDNYKNTAVGSQINFSLIAQPHYEFWISRSLSLHAGLSMVHYSNGSVATPNLGLNIFGATAGISFKTGNPAVVQKRTLNKFERSAHYTFFGATSSKQVYPADGKNYWIGSLSGTRSWQLWRKSAIGLGADIFYDPSIKHKIDQNHEGESDELDAFRVGVHAGYELVISQVSIIINMGGYLYSQYQEGDVYHRFGIRYQFSPNLFACMNIKSHWGKADFAEFGIGYRINK